MLMSAEQEVVFEASHRRQCFELRMVLLAAGIAARAIQDGTRWKLSVESQNFDSATQEIEAYLSEQDETERVKREFQISPPGRLVGIAGFAMVTVFFALFNSSATGDALMAVGNTHAANLLDGEWFRAVTALTLHQDFGHLLSNLIFGAIFGYLASEILGGGVAWLLILSGGALGNLFNALLREPSHMSIGASTAVFAALGLAVAHALWASLRTQERRLAKWKPLIGGVLLLAFLGIGGENTDVGAHFTGFFAGLILGLASLGIPSHAIRRVPLQLASGIAAAVVLAVAWACALGQLQ